MRNYKCTLPGLSSFFQQHHEVWGLGESKEPSATAFQASPLTAVYTAANGQVPARCRVKVALRHTYIILPQVTSHQRTSDLAQSSPGGQDKGVCHFKKKKK